MDVFKVDIKATSDTIKLVTTSLLLTVVTFSISIDFYC